MSFPTQEARLQAVGKVAKDGASLEMYAASVLACLAGNRDVGFTIVSGNTFAWVIDRLEALGERKPDELPGLAEWSRLLRAAARLRNRVVHDVLALTEDDGPGSIRLAKFGRPTIFDRTPDIVLENALVAIEEAHDRLKTLVPAILPDGLSIPN